MAFQFIANVFSGVELSVQAIQVLPYQHLQIMFYVTCFVYCTVFKDTVGSIFTFIGDIIVVPTIAWWTYRWKFDWRTEAHRNYVKCQTLTLPEIPFIRLALRGSKSTLMYPSIAVSSFLVVQLVEFACSHQLPWYHPGMIHWYLLPYMFRL